MKGQDEALSQSVRLNLERARAAQPDWESQPVRLRLRFLRELRALLALHGRELSELTAVPQKRSAAEKIVSEVLPLADACRWLEKRARHVLSPRRRGNTGRPFWLRGISFEVQRQPHGVVLVIAPKNYPLFIPAVQAVHALVAGNAVLLKPAPGADRVVTAFAKLVYQSGLNPALLIVLSPAIESGLIAIEQGVDKVIFTGSSENGRSVLDQLARQNTPAVMELSGHDPVVVLADADLDLLVRALRFGTEWNGGDTCIAPRKLIAVESVANELVERLAEAEIRLLRVQKVQDERAALIVANESRFGLGAAIFSRSVSKARELGARLRSGFVLVNDLIVPTADPRMPFGGTKASGFGVTRGDEGLLELTYPHVVALRRSKAYRHLDQLGPGVGNLFSSYLKVAHGKGPLRFAAFGNLVRAALTQLAKGRSNR